MKNNLYLRLKERYTNLWRTMVILSNKYPQVAYVAGMIAKYKTRYTLVDYIPYYVVGCLHYRECNFSFTRHLHNGDPLYSKTINIPKGRPPIWEPPYRWEVSALDAVLLKYNEVKRYTKLDCIEAILFYLEAYNGFGYWLYHKMPSPYLWSGSNHYKGGKYRSDGKFDPELIDKQVGCACIIYYGLQHQLWEL